LDYVPALDAGAAANRLPGLRGEKRHDRLRDRLEHGLRGQDGHGDKLQPECAGLGRALQPTLFVTVFRLMAGNMDGHHMLSSEALRSSRQPEQATDRSEQRDLVLS
jgi:hypothetical protein